MGRYVFQTASTAIKFAIERVDEKGGKKAILKPEKYNSHMVPESGEIMIADIGTCKYMLPPENVYFTKRTKSLIFSIGAFS